MWLVHRVISISKIRQSTDVVEHLSKTLHSTLFQAFKGSRVPEKSSCSAAYHCHKGASPTQGVQQRCGLQNMAGAPATLEDLPNDALMIKDVLATMVSALTSACSLYTPMHSKLDLFHIRWQLHNASALCLAYAPAPLHRA